MNNFRIIFLSTVLGVFGLYMPAPYSKLFSIP